MSPFGKIGAFAARYYLTSLFFAIFGAGTFCLGVYVTNQAAIAGVAHLEAAVKQQALAAAQ